MKSTEVIDTLRGAIASTKETGVKQVSIADLEAFAARLAETVARTPPDVAAGEAAMEAYRADLSAWVSSRQQHHEHNLEMLRATITTGQSALKSALLINGGAAVALLAFIGSIWTSSNAEKALTEISLALLLYVFGVLSAATAAGLTYFSQAGFGHEFGKASRPVGHIGRWLAVFGVLVSYVLFGSGSWLAFASLGGC
ncbi:MAG: hypothetical protein Q8K35_07550 [Thiobacillus sp.]|nr:hypothetical protein [Pseudomonadota bacterium]MDP2057598.1 hypothetical protein [Thiobacillus sp.]